MESRSRGSRGVHRVVAETARPLPDDVAQLRSFLDHAGIVECGEPVQWTALGGGVSSDIWRLDSAAGSYCIKRALAKLKVASDWSAPLSRSGYEWQWLQFAHAHIPANVPRPMAYDPVTGAVVMRYLDDRHHVLWKKQLLLGQVSVPFAAQVGSLVSSLHALSAVDPRVPGLFASDANFMALRLDPYFLHAGEKHPDLRQTLAVLVHRTANTRLAVVHGDVSPKNILSGPHGPVLLDAECAWFGDPAFDIAFCLNHLLLKSLLLPASLDNYLDAFHALWNAYRDGISWEDPEALEKRAAALLPALLLARVDGKSPVEYLAGAPDLTAFVRTTGRHLIMAGPSRISDIAAFWQEALGRCQI